jgi:hypothetical protein
MRFAWVRLGIAGCAAGLILVISPPGRAADQSGFTTVVAEELDKRSKEPQQQGLNDTRVRVMLTYAFSLIPAETPGPDGKKEPVDKSDFNTFVIPNDDARQVIRAATRSAYADVCGLPELGEANLKALMTQESKKNWTHKQMLMIEALHLFALSYFTGAAQIVEDGPEPTGGEAAASKEEESGKPVQPRVTQAPPPPKCPPEQKAKVENAIRAYVEAVQAN